MKRTRNNNKLLLVAFALLLLAGCKKEEASTTVSLTRRFSPATIATANGETSAAIGWTPSLFTTPEESVEYSVEFSKTPAFASIDHSLTSTVTTVVVTDNNLAIKQDYFVRVKANAREGTSESNWTMGGPFRITGEQFLLPVASNEVIDVGVILRWKPSSTLTKITLTPTGGAPVDVTLTPADLAANSKTVMGLTQNTNYAAEIFESAKTKGTASFKTVPAITGVNVIDLSANTTAPALNTGLLTALQTNPVSGTVIILRRGEQYSLTASYSFSQSVTIVSALGFGTNLAILRPTATFNVAAASVVDSIVFKNVVIKGGRAANASYTNDYVLNVNTASTVKLVRLEGCTIKILRGTIRGQGSPTKFENYVMNNCVLDSINDFSVAAVSNTSAFDNIRLTNSTFYKSLKFINHNVAAPNGRGSLSVLIENCTFNEVVSNQTANNYLIDYNANNVTSGITIRNCIFGKTWAAGGTFQQLGYRAGTSTGLTVTNTYATNDFTFVASPLTGTLPYSGPATSLFTAPDVGDFKIKDAGFVGKSSTGDPRWRIN